MSTTPSMYVRRSSREVDSAPWQVRQNLDDQTYRVIARFACETDAQRFAATGEWPHERRDHVRRAGEALAALAADVENGGTRLTNYPSELPALAELVAAVQDIQTTPTLSHDQLRAFAEIAHEASIGGLVDGNGAVSALSIGLHRGCGVAVVTSNDTVVATIAGDGTREWVRS